MQLTLVIGSVINTIVQLVSWFGWAVIILAIPAVFIFTVFTIRNSQFVQNLTTNLLARNTGEEQSQSTTGNTTRSNYTVDTSDSSGTIDEENRSPLNYSGEENMGADARVEPISGANSLGPVSSEGTTAGTPAQDSVDSNDNNDPPGVNGTPQSFDLSDSGSGEQDFESVKEPDGEFGRDDVFSAGRSPSVSEDFSSQFDSHQLTDSLTSMQSEDVFESSIGDVDDFTGSVTGVTDTTTDTHE